MRRGSSGISTFSAALSTGIRLCIWKMNPIFSKRTRSIERRSVTSMPPTDTVPAVGRSIAPMRLSSVVLPEPDGPVTATNSPGAIARSTPSSATTRPSSNVRVTPAKRTSASLTAQRLHRPQVGRAHGRVDRGEDADERAVE